MVKVKKRTLTLAIIMAFSTGALAQNNDFGLWLNGDISFNLGGVSFDRINFRILLISFIVTTQKRMMMRLMEQIL